MIKNDDGFNLYTEIEIKVLIYQMQTYQPQVTFLLL